MPESEDEFWGHRVKTSDSEEPDQVPTDRPKIKSAGRQSRKGSTVCGRGSNSTPMPPTPDRGSGTVDQRRASNVPETNITSEVDRNQAPQAVEQPEEVIEETSALDQIQSCIDGDPNPLSSAAREVETAAMSSKKSSNPVDAGNISAGRRRSSASINVSKSSYRSGSMSRSASSSSLSSEAGSGKTELYTDSFDTDVGEDEDEELKRIPPTADANQIVAIAAAGAAARKMVAGLRKNAPGAPVQKSVVTSRTGPQRVASRKISHTSGSIVSKTKPGFNKSRLSKASTSNLKPLASPVVKPVRSIIKKPLKPSGMTGRRAPKGVASKPAMNPNSSAQLREKVAECNQVRILERQLEELKEENRTLKIIQLRQDKAAAVTSKDPMAAASLIWIDRLQAEVRYLKEGLRAAKDKNRECERVLRERNDAEQKATARAKKLEQLLDEKGIDYKTAMKSGKTLALLQAELEEKKKKIHDLERQIELVHKNYQHQIAVESQRHKETLKRLSEVENITATKNVSPVEFYSADYLLVTFRRTMSDLKATNHNNSGRIQRTGQTGYKSGTISNPVSNKPQKSQSTRNLSTIADEGVSNGPRPRRGSLTSRIKPKGQKEPPPANRINASKPSTTKNTEINGGTQSSADSGRDSFKSDSEKAYLQLVGRADPTATSRSGAHPNSPSKPQTISVDLDAILGSKRRVPSVEHFPLRSGITTASTKESPREHKAKLDSDDFLTKLNLAATKGDAIRNDRTAEESQSKTEINSLSNSVGQESSILEFQTAKPKSASSKRNSVTLTNGASAPAPVKTKDFLDDLFGPKVQRSAWPLETRTGTGLGESNGGVFRFDAQEQNEFPNKPSRNSIQNGTKTPLVSNSMRSRLNSIQTPGMA